MAPTGKDEGFFVVKERFINRKYAEIPKDQEKLLAKKDAWDTRGVPNLPAKVLEGVKEAYSRRRSLEDVSAHLTPRKKGSSADGSSRQRNGEDGRKLERKQGQQSEDGEEDDEAESDATSWSSSPVHHKVAPARRDKPPTLRSESGHSPSSPLVQSSSRRPPPSAKARPPSSNAPSSPVLPTLQVAPPVITHTARQDSPEAVTQPPPTRPIRKGAAVTLKPRAPKPVPPPSSVASEADLEYQPPRAVTDVVSPRSKENRPLHPQPPKHQLLRSIQQPIPTPPSAQVPATIPCTWKEPGSAETRREMTEGPAKKRRKLHKPPPFEISLEQKQDDLAAPPGSVQDPITLGDSQTSNSSSAPSVIGRTSTNTYFNTVLTRDSRRNVLPKVNQPSEEGYDVVKPVDEDTLSSSDRLPPNGPASQAPFVAFCQSYPSYKGTVKDFVSAALNIISLQKTHSLSEFLYDDFIRIWAHKYVDYVKECGQQNTPPLSALQYYNETVPRPVFTKRIYTKGNIKDITEHHKAEAVSCRQKARYSLNSSSSPSATSPATKVTLTSAIPAPSVDSPPGNNKVVAVVIGASEPVEVTGAPLADHKTDDVAQPAESSPNPSGNVLAMIRPEQIETVEPLRSVPGYVVTISQPSSPEVKKAREQQSPLLATPRPVKKEDDDSPQVQAPAINTEVHINDSLPSSASVKAKTAHSSTAPPKEGRPAAVSDTDWRATTTLTEWAADYKALCLQHWNITSEEFEDFFCHSLTQERPLQTLVKLSRLADWERAQTLLSAAHALREAVADDWAMFEVEMAVKQCLATPQKQDESLAGAPVPIEDPDPATEGPLMLPADPPSRRADKTPMRPPSPRRAYRPRAPDFERLHEPAMNPPSSATVRPKSPDLSCGDILTQPPATAGSFISDFSRSIIPETAIKPKDVPRFHPPPPAKPRTSLVVDIPNAPPASFRMPTVTKAKDKDVQSRDVPLPQSRVSLPIKSENNPPSAFTTPVAKTKDDQEPLPQGRVSLPTSFENKPPSSSAVPTSSSARRRKLTKAEKWRLFLEMRRAEGRV